MSSLATTKTGPTSITSGVNVGWDGVCLMGVWAGIRGVRVGVGRRFLNFSGVMISIVFKWL